MNILLLNWRDPWHPYAGGAEIVTMEHVKRWVSMGHTVTWVTGGYWEQKQKDEVVDGVRFIRFGGILTIHIIAPLYLLAESRKFDVIVDEIHGIPFFSPLFTKKPVVAFIHEVAGEIWDYMYRWPISWLGKLLERMTLRLYRSCFVWTDAPSMTKELIREGIEEKRITAIPCPIATVVPKLEFKKEKDLTCIFVSRVVRMKGIEEVVKAFSFIHREKPKANLWIVGKGRDAYIKELQKMMKEYGIFDKVTFFGKLTDREKMERLGRSHILLHASVREGWGLVVLEAASVGTPAVVYNVPGLCDVVKHGKTGVVVASSTPREMAKEALLLIGDKKRYAVYQQEGKKWVASLSWETVAKESISVLQKAVQGV